MHSYAQNFEDVYVYRAFTDVRDGFYVDVGAYDPDEDSVTKLFYDLGWSGVNVEPGPSFDRFVKSRPRDVNLKVAVSAKPGRARFFYHEGDPGTSTVKPRLSPQLKGRVGERHEMDVEAVTLASLMERHCAGRTINFLKLDIEGLEAEVVGSVDWRVHRPELIITEATRPYTNTRIDRAWTPVLRRSGYELVFFDGINTYYLREESRKRREAFFGPVNVLDGFVKYDRRLADLTAEVARLQKEAAKANNVVTLRNVPSYKVEDAVKADEQRVEAVAAASRSQPPLTPSATAAPGVERAKVSVPGDSVSESAARRPLPPVTVDGIEGAADGVRLEMGQSVGKGAPPAKQEEPTQPSAGPGPQAHHDSIQSLREEAAVLFARIAAFSSDTGPAAPALAAVEDFDQKAAIAALAAVEAARAGQAMRAEAAENELASLKLAFAQQIDHLKLLEEKLGEQSQALRAAHDALESERTHAEAAALSASHAYAQHAQEMQRRMEAESLHALARADHQSAEQRNQELSTRAEHFEQSARELQSRLAQVHAELVEASQHSEVNYEEAQHQRIEKEDLLRAIEEMRLQVAQSAAAAARELQEQETAFQARINEALEDNRRLQVSVAALQEVVTTSESVAQSMAADLQRVAAENVAVQQELATVRADSGRNLAQSADAWRQQEEALQTRIADALEDKRRLTEAVAALELRFVAAETARSAAIAEAQKASAERAAAEQLLENVRGEADRSLSAAVDLMREKEAALRASLNEAQEGKRQLTLSVSALEARASAAEGALAVAAAEKDQLTAANADIQRKLETVREEADRSLAVTVDAMRQQEAVLQAQIASALHEKRQTEERLAEVSLRAEAAGELERQLAVALHEASLTEHRFAAARQEHAVMLEAALQRPVGELKLVEAALGAAQAEILRLKETAARAEHLGKESLQLRERVRDLEAHIAIAEREHAVVMDAVLDRPLREISILEASLATARADSGRLDAEAAALRAHAVQREQQFAQQLLDAVAPINVERAALQLELMAASEAEKMHRRMLEDVERAYRAELMAASEAASEAEKMHRRMLDELELAHSEALHRAAEMHRHELDSTIQTYCLELEDVRQRQSRENSDRDSERAQLGSELAQANSIHRHVENQHRALSGMFNDIVAERDMLYHDLKLKGGPRALRMVLPLARIIRMFGGKNRRSPVSPEKSRPASLVGGGNGDQGVVRVAESASPSRGILRVAIVPVVLWVARRFPKQTRSLWMEVRARAPDTVLSPPIVAPPATAATEGATAASATDPLLARKVQEALLTMTIQKEMQTRT